MSIARYRVVGNSDNVFQRDISFEVLRESQKNTSQDKDMNTRNIHSLRDKNKRL